jgi:hypothetical protein
MVQLDSILRKINPFYFAFKNMREVEIVEEEKAKRFAYPIPTVIILFFTLSTFN